MGWFILTNLNYNGDFVRLFQKIWRIPLPHRVQFALKKLLRMVLLLLGVSLAAFLLLTLSPVDPVAANVGQTALGSMSGEQIQRLEVYWGKDRSPVERYLSWLSGVLHGDWGTSLLYRRPVTAVMGEKLMGSLFVLVLAWAVSGFLGFCLGALAGSRRGSPLDRGVGGYCFLLSSTPTFWLALLLLLVFSVWLKVLPIGFAVPIGAETGAVTLGDRLAHAVLPALTLSITGVANIALHTREKMTAVMQSDYVLFARARGETEWSILLRHGLRNVALPALTLQCASIGELIGASVLVEQVFSYPGLGQAAVAAGLGGDLPLLMGVTLLTALLVFGGNLLADLLYGAVDPRIRRRGGR